MTSPKSLKTNKEDSKPYRNAAFLRKNLIPFAIGALSGILLTGIFFFTGHNRYSPSQALKGENQQRITQREFGEDPWHYEWKFINRIQVDESAKPLQPELESKKGLLKVFPIKKNWEPLLVGTVTGILVSLPFFFFFSCRCLNEEVVPWISYKEFQKNTDYYKSMAAPHMWDVVKNSTDTTSTELEELKKPALMCTFTFKRLRSFMAQVERIAKVDNPDSLALTWYYAIYKESHPAGGFDYKGLQTLYAVPSEMKGDYAEPFFLHVPKPGVQAFENLIPKRPWLWNAVTGFVRNIFSTSTTMNPVQKDNPGSEGFNTIPGPESEGSMLFAIAGETGKATNQGALCPPNCPGQDQ